MNNNFQSWSTGGQQPRTQIARYPRQEPPINQFPNGQHIIQQQGSNPRFTPSTLDPRFSNSPVRNQRQRWFPRQPMKNERMLLGNKNAADGFEASRAPNQSNSGPQLLNSNADRFYPALNNIQQQPRMMQPNAKIFVQQDNSTVPNHLHIAHQGRLSSGPHIRERPPFQTNQNQPSLHGANPFHQNQPSPHGANPFQQNQPSPHGANPFYQNQPSPHGVNPFQQNQPSPHGVDPFQKNQPSPHGANTFHQNMFSPRFFPPNRPQFSTSIPQQLLQSGFSGSPFSVRPTLQNQRNHISMEQGFNSQVHLVINERSPHDVKEEYKDVMKGLVETWLKSRNISKKSKQDHSFIKIYEYKQKMKGYLLKLEELRDLNDKLAENMEVDIDTWSKLIADASLLKNDVLTRQTQLFNASQVEYISKQIKDRRKRRDRIKRKRKKDTEQYLASLSNRIKLNEAMDEWQHKEQKKSLLEKIDENLKTEAGESLVEVKRKQTEANEYIKIFQSLKEIRDVRRKTAIFKGILVTENDNTAFDLKADGAIELLIEQKKVYEDEERALRVLREEEAEELSRVESEKRKKRKQSRQQDLNLVDPMFTYRLYWLQAEDNINNFIHTRGLWDIYLCQPECPDGSRLPKYWIEAGLPSNKDWDKFLVHKNTNAKKRKSNHYKHTAVD